MNEPSIAVIIPNRNDARYLPRCLRSVLDQETGPDELIIVDDQSTDDSVAVIRSLIESYPGAQLVENPVNLGTNGALNEGLRRTRSEYALFLAANDLVLPGIFAHAKRCLAKNPGAGLWSAMAWLVDEDDKLIRLHPSAVVALNDTFLQPQDCVKLAHRFGNWFTGTTVIYNLATLQAIGSFDPAYGAPADLIASLTIASLKGAAYTPEPYAAIRIHAGSFSSRALNNVAGLDAMLARLRTRGPQMSPRLFNAAFLDRFTLRFYFAAIRASGGAAVAEIALRVKGWKRASLLWENRLLPAALRLPRVALAFLILRPFDILPTLWYRFCGWAVIRVRLQLRRRAPP